jgi:hypothetical protein
MWQTGGKPVLDKRNFPIVLLYLLPVKITAANGCYFPFYCAPRMTMSSLMSITFFLSFFLGKNEIDCLSVLYFLLLGNRSRFCTH